MYNEHLVGVYLYTERIEKMSLITVVMPVYNTRNYLDKAIESVVSQTLSDFEFYIIDNGCTDGSSDVIRKWKSKDTRISVIKNEKNMLISDARNSAIQKANSKYLCFIDSDDWIESTMLEDMVNTAERDHADLVITGFLMEYYQQGKLSSYPVIVEERRYSKQQFMKDAYIFFNKTLLAVPWNKLYKLEHIKKFNIRFMNTKWEDHHFNMDYLMDCDNVSVLGKAYYHYYRSRPGSDSEVVYDKELYKKRKEHFAHTMRLYKNWQYWDAKTELEMANYYSGRMLQCIQEASCFQGLCKQEKIVKIKEILSDEMTRKQLKKSHPESLAMRLCLLPMKWNSVVLCYAEGTFISAVKKNFSNAFYRIRAKEAQGVGK